MERSAQHSHLQRSAVRRAGAAPHGGPPGPYATVLELQHSAGNRAVASVLGRDDHRSAARPGGRHGAGSGVPVQRLFGKKKKDKPVEPPKTGIVTQTPWTGSKDTREYSEMVGNVDLGKGSDKIKDRGGYEDKLAEYVSLAQLRSAQIRKASDQTGYDYISLQGLHQDYLALKNAPPTTDPDIAKGRVELLNAYKTIVGEHTTGKPGGVIAKPTDDFDVNFDAALGDSAMWADRGQKAGNDAAEERVNIEALWDQVKSSNDEQIGKTHAQEAKTSLDHLEVIRAQMKVRVEHLTNIGRVQWAGGKILDSITTGVASFGLSLATLGILGVEKEMNPLFYKGTGWTWHSKMPSKAYLNRTSLLSKGKDAKGKTGKGKDSKEALPKEKEGESGMRLVLMENLVGKVEGLKRMLAQRKGGANGLDWLSGLLWFAGDGVLQSLMAVGSRIAIWLSLVSLLLGLINVPAHGALSPVIAVLSSMALAITYIRFAMAAVKAVITLARLAVDGLNAAINNDPRMAQALKGRAIKSGVGLVGDSLQLGGFAVVLGGDALKEGVGHFTNAFDPTQDLSNISGSYNDALQGVSTSITSAPYLEGTGAYLGGVATILTGVDALPGIGEAVSDTNDLNATGESHYLGGSNQKSHELNMLNGHGGHGGHPGTGPGRQRSGATGGQPGGWVRARPKELEPTWMQQGKARQEEMRGERATYLTKETSKKVAVSQEQVAGPVGKVRDASDKASKFGAMLDKVKAFFSGEKKKKNPDVPTEEIDDQTKATEENQVHSKRFAVILEDTAGALTNFSS
ncbi:MAG TPA: hypothetical protein VMD59_05970 [Acidimicrobiales bacterium]|nr:hypothetical protein [Acidimicrobiales bacterium]